MTQRSLRPRVPRLPAPIAALGRLLGVPIVEVRRYWIQEARSIRTASAALGVGMVATLVAGTVLGVSRTALGSFPGLLVVIPAAIGIRGSIFGALTARLGTGMLTGQYEPALRRGSFLGRQLEAAALLTGATALEVAAIAWAVSAVLGLPTVGLLDLTAVLLVSGVVASAVMVVATVSLSRQADRRGWDMDDVGAPTITAAGDLVGLPALLGASLLLLVAPVAKAVGVLGVVAGVATVVVGWRHRDSLIRAVVRESLVVLTVAVVVSIAAGVVLESRTEQLLALPAVLVLIPPFIAICGSLGGILASRLASKLHVGTLSPRGLPDRVAALDFSLAGLLALVGFTGVGIVGWAAAVLAGMSPGTPWTLVAIAVVAGLLATVLIAAVAYGAAVTTFHFGFDPDNHGIPLVTAAMDLLGILCLVAAIALLQVG